MGCSIFKGSRARRGRCAAGFVETDEEQLSPRSDAQLAELLEQSRRIAHMAEEQQELLPHSQAQISELARDVEMVQSAVAEQQRRSDRQKVIYYRSSLLEKAEDVYDDILAWLHLRKVACRSHRSVRRAIVLYTRVSMALDIYTDFLVGWDAWKSGQPHWAVGIFFIMVLTYILMWLAVWTEFSQRVQDKTGCRSYPSRFCIQVTWFLFGVPTLIIADVVLGVIYLTTEPADVEIFHYMKLRGLIELVEGVLQAIMQGIMLLSMWCLPFHVHFSSIGKFTIAASVAFSALSAYTHYVFLAKYAALQAKGSKWQFFQHMLCLGRGLVPSSLYQEIEILAEVDCPHKLNGISLREMHELSRFMQKSATLRTFRFQDASVLDPARLPHSASTPRLLPRRNVGDTTLFVENLMHSVALQDLQIEDGLSEDAVNLILHVVSRMWSNSGALKRIQLIANRIIVDWDDWRVWDGEKALSLHPRELVEMHIDALREHLPQYSGCRVMIFHDSSSMKIVSSDRDVCGMSFNDGEVQVDSAYWVKIAIRRGEKPNVRTEGEAKAANGSSVSLAARQGSWQQLRSELLRRQDVREAAAAPGLLEMVAQRGGTTQAKVLDLLLVAGALPGAEALCKACISGETQQVQILLRHGADAMCCRPFSDRRPTPMHIAVEKNFVDILRLLIQNSADMNAVDSLGQTPLFYAAANQSVEATQLLVDQRADVFKSDEKGMTALHGAAAHGSVDVCGLLLKSRASIDARMKDGTTPLFLASRSDAVHTVEFLLDHRAEVNKGKQNGTTPACVAATKNAARTLQVLLQHKADINMTDNNGRGPFQLAREQGSMDALAVLQDPNMPLADGVMLMPKLAGKAAGRWQMEPVLHLVHQRPDVNASVSHLILAAGSKSIEAVKLLLERRADVNQQTGRLGETALHTAAENGSVDVCGLLLKSRAGIDAQMKDGTTPLFLASQSNAVHTVEFLLDHRAEVNKGKQNGTTPACVAAFMDAAGALQVLLQHRADINMTDHNGRGPFQLAREQGSMDALAVLQDPNMPLADGVMLMQKLSGNVPDSLLKYALDLVHQRPDVNASVSHLILAAGSKSIEAVKLLLERRADVNQQTGRLGETALHTAAENGSVDVCGLLLKSRAGIDAQMKDGTTPLFLASQSNAVHTVEFLLDHRAEVNKGKQNGTTPACVAAFMDAAGALQVLLQHRADINMTDHNGRGPFQLAREQASVQALDLLGRQRR
ncbi:Ank3 [Symbiodinium natans]|uniref:Ank3 protein n=1 Tax=Symbiodinium natans TaxID=878477 RepID=A0A812R8G6_9DINO|nr:Ank3 [Symbiodinium natans]